MNPNDPSAVLKLIDREVWVLTAASGGRRGGLTATWVAPATFDSQRPALLVSLTANHFTTELIAAGGRFIAHLLRDDQPELAWNFAYDSSRHRDKFAGLEPSSHDSGQPLLTDCLAWCECVVFARHAAGDRRLFWADVVAAQQLGSAVPLREQAFLRSLSEPQRQMLATARTADTVHNRLEYQQWRQACQSPPPLE